ncbi:MAG: hypothetical protein E7323_03715 [Clostridiales bacterium]|nr:hypothetical protein [Clostridiales bacterium]
MQQNPFQGMTPEQQMWQQQNQLPPMGGNMPPMGMPQQPVQQPPFGMQPPQDPLFTQQPVMGQPMMPNPMQPVMSQQPMMPQANPFAMQQPMPQPPMMQAPVAPQQWPPPGAQQAMTPEMMQQQMQFEAMQWQMAQQQAFPTQPVVRKPKKQKQPKPPKQKGEKRGGGKAILAVLLVLALAGAGAYFFFLRDPGDKVSTAQIEMGMMGNTFRGDALIVRNETAFDEEGVQNIEYEAEEGSLVYRTNPLCYVYSTGYSTNEMNTLQDYRDQINDYQQTLLAAETAYDQRMEMLETEVIERGLEVRSLVQGSRGDLINQENILATAITQRQNYFRSKYASDMRLSRLYDDENTQLQRIESWIKPKLATQESSIVSFYTDGFEHALSPELFETYTPSQVRSMINGIKPETSAAERGRIDLYRLVKKDNYAVLMLINDRNWNPTNDEVYQLTLEQFTSTKVQAKVLSYARSGGELLIRLAVVGDVSDVLYMRTCEATISEAVQCMTVPVAALYTQNGSKGVVINQNGVPSFVPVNVLNEAEGKAYIQPIQSGVLTEGMDVQLFN